MLLLRSIPDGHIVVARDKAHFVEIRTWRRSDFKVFASRPTKKAVIRLRFAVSVPTFQEVFDHDFLSFRPIVFVILGFTETWTKTVRRRHTCGLPFATPLHAPPPFRDLFLLCSRGDYNTASCVRVSPPGPPPGSSRPRPSSPPRCSSEVRPFSATRRASA